MEIRVPLLFLQFFKHNQFFYILEKTGRILVWMSVQMPVGVDTYICMSARKSHASISGDFVLWIPLSNFSFSYLLPSFLFGRGGGEGVIRCRATSELSRSFKDFLENVTFWLFGEVWINYGSTCLGSIRNISVHTPAKRKYFEGEKTFLLSWIFNPLISSNNRYKFIISVSYKNVASQWKKKTAFYRQRDHVWFREFIILKNVLITTYSSALKCIHSKFFGWKFIVYIMNGKAYCKVIEETFVLKNIFPSYQK